MTTKNDNIAQLHSKFQIFDYSIAYGGSFAAATNVNDALKALETDIANIVLPGSELPALSANKWLFTNGISTSWQSLPVAADNVAGIVTLGSQAEINANTAGIVPTMDQLALWTGLPGPGLITKEYSTEIQMNDASTTTVSHGLGSVPVIFSVFLKCTTADIGYVPGDILPFNLSAYGGEDRPSNQNISITASATQLIIRQGSEPYIIHGPTLTTNYGNAHVTDTSWKYIIKAYAKGPTPYVPLINTYTSPQITITPAAGATLTHGLSGIPANIQAFLVCQTAEHGYLVGDVVPIPPAILISGGGGINLALTPTTIKYKIGTPNTFNVLNLSTGVNQVITNANWKLLIKAWI